MKQFMVRILQNGDTSDFADVPVDAENELSAKITALTIVRSNPGIWFDEPPPPTYSVDESSDVEELDGAEYSSANS